MNKKQEEHNTNFGMDDFICGVETFTLETKEVDNTKGNAAKTKLVQCYDYYEKSIVMITSNIELIKSMHDHSVEIQTLYDCAPFFINNAYLNAWYSIVVKICRLFGNDETCFDRFLNFVEQNESLLFTADYYQRWVPSGKEKSTCNEIEWEKVERNNLKEVINKDRLTLQDCQQKVSKVKAIRDKIFAHMDKEMLDIKKQDNCLSKISINLLDDLARKAGDIFNSIYYYDKNTVFHFPIMNYDDVLNLSRRCKWYQDHKEEIVRIRLGVPVKND